MFYANLCAALKLVICVDIVKVINVIALYSKKNISEQLCIESVLTRAGR
jgi:hypothetical protein